MYASNLADLEVLQRQIGPNTRYRVRQNAGNKLTWRLIYLMILVKICPQISHEERKKKKAIGANRPKLRPSAAEQPKMEVIMFLDKLKDFD